MACYGRPQVKTRKVEEPSGDNWSRTQQSALEAALAKIPKGAKGDRWQKIANAVPGKTTEECMRRFKYVSEMLRNQKIKLLQEGKRNTKTKRGHYQRKRLSDLI
nr:uncharacterized protein F54F2.9-like [Vanessa tameamea]